MRHRLLRALRLCLPALILLMVIWRPTVSRRTPNPHVTLLLVPQYSASDHCASLFIRYIYSLPDSIRSSDIFSSFWGHLKRLLFTAVFNPPCSKLRRLRFIYITNDVLTYLRTHLLIGVGCRRTEFVSWCYAASLTDMTSLLISTWPTLNSPVCEKYSPGLRHRSTSTQTWCLRCVYY